LTLGGEERRDKEERRTDRWGEEEREEERKALREGVWKREASCP